MKIKIIIFKIFFFQNLPYPLLFPSGYVITLDEITFPYSENNFIKSESSKKKKKDIKKDI
jgi:hypothetical protein